MVIVISCKGPVGLSHYSLIMLIVLCFPRLGAEAREDATKLKPNTKRYDCPDCLKTLYLTPTEMLKHKKSHL